MPDQPPVGAIVQGDVLKILPQWPDECVDLVFADPPFNIGYAYDKYHDRVATPQYLTWTRRWIDQCLRILKPHGTMWIAIGDEYAAEIRLMMRPRATLRNWVIWRYTFGQCCKGKFNRSHAHLFYFAKDPKHFTFNNADIRVPSDRQLKYDDARANPTGKLPDDVWTFSRVCGTFRERVGWHPCQMPLDVLDLIIRACSKPGDIVFDPFAGSGTTLVVAARLGRQWVGTELSEQYAAKALERVAVEGNQPPPEKPKPVPLVKHRRAGSRNAKAAAKAEAAAKAAKAAPEPAVKRRGGRPPKKPADRGPTLLDLLDPPDVAATGA